MRYVKLIVLIPLGWIIGVVSFSLIDEYRTGIVSPDDLSINIFLIVLLGIFALLLYSLIKKEGFALRGEGIKYYLKALRKYACFNGRANRKEYWMFFLCNMLIFGFLSASNIILATIYNWAVLVPSLAVGVRRMHDINKSGWYILVPIYNIILLLKEGTKGDNKYGTDSKTESPESVKNLEKLFCSKCGIQIDLDSKFCAYCGAKVAPISS